MTFSKLDFWLIRLRRPVSRGDRAIHRLAWLAAIAFVLFVLAPRPRRSFPCDLYQMWVAGQAITTMPMGNIYSGIGRLVAMEEFRIRAQSIQSPSLRTAVTDRSLMDITATPLLLATIHLFGSKNFETELWWFRGASAAVYGLGFLALAAALGFSGLWALGLVVLFTNHFWPYHMNMMVANVSALQAGLFMLVLALLRGATPARQGLIGLLLGLLTVAKPTLAPAPIVLLASYAADRRKPDALWFSAGLAVAARPQKRA